jgi:hypothetical protein
MPHSQEMPANFRRATPLTVVAAMLVALASSACDRSSEATPLPTAIRTGTTSSVPTITAFSWASGWCGGDFSCEVRATIDGPRLVLRSGSTADLHEGTLTEQGVRGLWQLADDILATNPRRFSGGPGVALDGTTFALTIDSEGQEPWSGSWGFQRAVSPFHRAFDRTQRLVKHAAACQEDPWLTATSSCVPIENSSEG